MSCNYQPDEDTVCFIDSFSRDQRGLTQQYLDALLSLKTKRIVFISETEHIGVQIKRTLDHNRANVFTVNHTEPIPTASEIISIVQAERPSYIIYHLTPDSIAPLVATCKLRFITRCQINLTDHAFWLGDNTIFDYSFEFRKRGVLVSNVFRGFNKEQLVLLPYYPWIDGAAFQGFPINSEGKIVLFSGGALYKTEDKDGTYFRILKEILERHHDVVFFYAGDGDKSHFTALSKRILLKKECF